MFVSNYACWMLCPFTTGGRLTNTMWSARARAPVTTCVRDGVLLLLFICTCTIYLLYLQCVYAYKNALCAVYMPHIYCMWTYLFAGSPPPPAMLAVANGRATPFFELMVRARSFSTQWSLAFLARTRRSHRPPHLYCACVSDAHDQIRFRFRQSAPTNQPAGRPAQRLTNIWWMWYVVEHAERRESAPCRHSRPFRLVICARQRGCRLIAYDAYALLLRLANCECWKV